ncbi:MAG TPA: amino acid permease [Fermentimonas caenicola]|uniref:amino acid permease n=1 Tax=Lascolabacillus sp. TaxID=1924068 RepID=UPI001210325F|nr:amino acid permease [Lascolabacillus sp.]MDD2606910.1 amino acid permease [Lascolabacillus sp.]TAH62468.1 MAG: amino acid permease [Fermentimonas caenicola]HHU42103.1 amino acid permease [Fermentimonas caenicola]
MQKKDQKLGLWLLVFIALGSMIGSGIFNSPKDLISSANPQGAMIAWLIGGFGALMLALVFVYLAARKPELKSGIYAYARDGFGDFMGFNSAWGYWSLGWLGNIGFIALFFKTFNDLLGDKAISPLQAFIIGSLIIWIFFFILKAGIREGAILNFIVTTAKLIPVILIIVLGVLLVKSDLFIVENWQTRLASTGEPTSPTIQIKSAMAIILWCFVGMEAASVLSGRAKSQKIVRLTIIISLLIVLGVYMLITFIAMSSIPADKLAASETPLALVLEQTAVGAAGGVIVKLGIMVSVLGASFSWIMLSVETLYVAAVDNVLPRIFKKVNKNGTPVTVLLITQGFTQIFLISILSPKLNETYLAAITIATTLALIPYLLSSLYAVKIAMINRKRESLHHLIIALLGTIYSLYVIFAVGIKYLILSLLFYAIGSLLFIKAKREQKKQPKPWEWAVIVLLLIGSLIITGLIFSGKIIL